MTSYYVLMLGKGNLESFNKVRLYRSNCYFDWIGFACPVIEEKSQIIADVLSNSVYPETIKNRNISCQKNDYHILQDILLMTDETDNLLKKLNNTSQACSFLYISFVCSNVLSDSGINVFEKIKDAVYKIIDDKKILISKQNISVYSTFDHCENIIICDGSKVELRRYISFLKKLKANEHISDILSIYAYDSNSDNWSKEHVFALVKHDENVSDKINGKYKNYSALGRFNHLKVFDDIEINELFRAVDKLSFCNGYQKTFIGIESNLLEDTPNRRSIDSMTMAINKKVKTACGKFIDDCNGFFKTSMEAQTYLVGGLKEIENMLVSILERGTSKYFVLCIFESYITLLNFLSIKVIASKDKDFKHNYGGVELPFRRHEVLINIINSYFNYIQVLSSSMLHNERKYINADPYQLSYFNFPPRLIAFYTAISSEIISLLKTRNSGSYTAMIVPDFKQDIYVDSLTQNRDYEKEHNLIIIHVNEKASYDILDTIKVIAHEIAHHVGQSTENRRMRAKLYVKCCIAMIIKEAFSKLCSTSKNVINGNEMWNLVIGRNPDKYFSILVDNIYDSAGFEQLLKLNDINGQEVWYYTSSLIENFVKHCKEVKYEVICDAFEKFLHDIKFNCIKRSKKCIKPNSSFVDLITNADKDFAIKLIYNIFATDFGNAFMNCEIEDIELQGEIKNYKFFKFITYLFCEGMADVQMLALLDNEYIYDCYYKENISNRFENANDIFFGARNIIVQCSFLTTVSDKFLKFDKDPNENTTIKYICLKAIEYFKIIKTEKTLENLIDRIKDAVTIEEIIDIIDEKNRAYFKKLSS